jgi:glyoxylase-like metal-dependent hydrolase (beta-lactamase superfamily II)
VRELKSGLWHWTAPHPEWDGQLRTGRPGEPWDRVVSSYALIDEDERLLVFDPLAVPAEIEELADGRETAIVLTAPWHERDTERLVERHSWPLFAPPPESEDDLMEKFGVTREQVAGGSPDLRWLRERDDVEGHLFSPGDPLPLGVESFPALSKHEAVFWIESHRALVTGDALADVGRGPELQAEDATREQVVGGLRPLLELPVELVLPAHGPPTDRAALERALS